MSNTNYSLDFELNDNNFLSNLFGIDDKNIQIIEKNNNVKIKYRGNKIKIIGSKTSIKDTKEEILILFEEAKKGVNIDEDKIMETRSVKLLEISPDEQMNLFFQTKKRKILPRPFFNNTSCGGCDQCWVLVFFSGACLVVPR